MYESSTIYVISKDFIIYSVKNKSITQKKNVITKIKGQPKFCGVDNNSNEEKHEVSEEDKLQANNPLSSTGLDHPSLVKERIETKYR